MTVVNIEGFDDSGRAKLLAALYNNIRSDGYEELMSVGQAQKLLEQSSSKNFECINGKELHIDLSKDTIDTQIYERSNVQKLRVNARDIINVVQKKIYREEQQALAAEASKRVKRPPPFLPSGVASGEEKKQSDNITWIDKVTTEREEKIKSEDERRL